MALLRLLAFATGALLVALFSGSEASAADRSVRLDYAYYNPVSLILKDKDWLEQELAAQGVQVSWVLSLGSNKALEFLNGESLDFGSTAAAASFVGKANGNPIKAIYVYSRPEWTALVTLPGTGISAVADLAGKRVAATRGTDPFIFLLRALAANGLSSRDVTLVPLQHGDGRAALVRGDVDAWAGLDPYMAQAEVQDGAKLFFRDTRLISAGVLNVRERFAAENPDIVGAVLAVYERGRAYALTHGEELRTTLATAAKLSPEVAAVQLTRTDLSRPSLDQADVANVTAAGATLKESGIIPASADVDAIATSLIDGSYMQKLSVK